MSKFSVLFLYRRIFSVVPRTKIYMHLLNFLVIAYWLSSIFGVIFSFLPVYTQWQPWLLHTNIHVRAFYEAMIAINTSIDVAILSFIPTTVWKIHISRKKTVLIT
jgi:hypothetical protein